MPRVLSRLRYAALLVLLPGAQLAAARDNGDLAPAPPPGESQQEQVHPRYLRSNEPAAASPQQSVEAPRALRVGFQAREDVSTANAALPDETPNARSQAPLPLAAPSEGVKPGFRGQDASTLVTGAASLGIVLGLFMLVVWVVRRGMPKQAGLLPREAVEVLGRAPLVGRQHVHLVRCGNKILLLCLSPGGAETLTEITDPLEVDRLAGICQQNNPQSSTAAFRQVFGQFGNSRSAQHFEADGEEMYAANRLDPRGYSQELHA